MPRKLNDYEIEQQKDYMYKKAVALIREKGLHDLTLIDITDAAQMAKGSFYKYYKTKEEFLYQVIKRNEKKYFDLMMSELQTKKHTRDQLCSVLEQCFLSEECLFGYLLPEDLEYLVRHLPKDLQTKEALKSHMNFTVVCKLVKLKETPENYAALSYLMDGLQAILRSPAHYGDAGRKRAASIMTTAIAEFMLKESEEP